MAHLKRWFPRTGGDGEFEFAELRQVIYAPKDKRQPCYESACLVEGEHDLAGLENPVYTPDGYWTFDGQYWYVWGRHRALAFASGWEHCNPSRRP